MNFNLTNQCLRVNNVSFFLIIVNNVSFLFGSVKDMSAFSSSYCSGFKRGKLG